MDLRSTVPVDAARPFKDQARLLEKFLAAGGHAIKYAHALEAIAQIHGYANFHLLKHATETSGIRAPTQSEDSPWLIATYGAGILPALALAPNFEAALATFLAQLARCAACATDIEITVRAQATGPDRGLYAFDAGALICSLTRPPVVAHSLPAGLAWPFRAEQTLSSIANEITYAFWEREGWVDFVRQVHDEKFRMQLQGRLEDQAVRGATSMPEEFNLSVERLDAIVDVAHRVRVTARASADAGGAHAR